MWQACPENYGVNSLQAAFLSALLRIRRMVNMNLAKTAKNKALAVQKAIFVRAASQFGL